MDTIIKIVVATFVGTTIMTAFSYVLSKTFKRRWLEPDLLTYVINSTGTDVEVNRTCLSWIIHYLIGLTFVLMYEISWELYFNVSWVSGLLLGIISGMVGIIGWIVMLKITAAKSITKFTAYFIQLFFAHILFAISVVAVYKLFLFYYEI